MSAGPTARAAAARPIASSVGLQAEAVDLDRQRKPRRAFDQLRSRRRSRSCAPKPPQRSSRAAARPPPPLIRPGRDRSRRRRRSSDRVRAFRRAWTGGTPSSRQSAAVRSEVGTPTIFMPAATFSASSRTNSSAVEPVPMPSRMPSPTWARAARAASIFNALASMKMLSPPDCRRRS